MEMAESVDVISCEGLVGIGRGSGGGGRDAQEQRWRERWPTSRRYQSCRAFVGSRWAWESACVRANLQRTSTAFGVTPGDESPV